MFHVEMVDGEYQLGAARYQRSEIPEIFYTPANGGHWVFTRNADIEHALSTPELFSATKAYVPIEKNPNPPLVPMMADPPDHAKYRALLAPAFLPRSIMALTQSARELSIALINGFKPRGECEFISEFGHVLPVGIFLRMVDLPESDRKMLQGWSDAYVRPVSLESHQETLANLKNYALTKIRERRANPGDDLITSISRAKVDGKAMDDDAIAALLTLLLLAGTDTVGSTMGFFARFLALSPPSRRQLLDHPDLIPDAVDELMRRYTVTTIGRVVAKDHEYKGVTFRAGEMLILPLIFTGLDPTEHKDPLTVNFTRPDMSHGAFGMGVHRCIGAVLARAELKIFLEEWLPRIPDFSIKQGEPVVVTSGTVSGIRRMVLAWPT